MKHKQFEHWILDEVELTSDQQRALNRHIEICPECRKLQKGWIASSLLLRHPSFQSPAPGFTARWAITFDRKKRVEKIRNYRLSLFGLLMLSFVTALVFLVASGSFSDMLAATFNSVAQLIVGITNGLSYFGYWIRQTPPFVPFTIGFLLFGMLSAFLLGIGFVYWNLQNRRKLVYESAKK